MHVMEYHFWNEGNYHFCGKQITRGNECRLKDQQIIFQINYFIANYAIVG